MALVLYFYDMILSLGIFITFNKENYHVYCFM